MKASKDTHSYNSASTEITFAGTALGQQLIQMLSEGSNSNKVIADYLLRNHIGVTGLGVEALAENCNVSTATVSRFARDIGFQSYGAMRSEIAQTLQQIVQPVDKLRNKIAAHEGVSRPGIESLENAVANIAASVQALPDKTMERIIQKISKTNSVYVLGFGMSSYLAGFFALHLQPFCKHVIEVASSGGTEVAAGNLANISSKDVLISISFPRYTLDAIKLTQYAKKKGACVVSITDSPASPIAELADLVLYSQSNHAVLPSSSVTALAMIEALVVMLMVSNEANVRKAAMLTEAISSYMFSENDPANKRRGKI